MAPISLLEAYSGGLGDDAYYQQQDPFFQGGRAILGMQAQPTTNAEAIWGPLIQGLIGGGLAGYGKKRAADAAFADYSANPLLDALSTSRQPSEQEMGLRTIQAALGDPLATGLVGLPAQDPIHNYLATERPRGWTARTGKSDLLMAALQADTVKAYQEKQLDQRNDLIKALLPMGGTINDKGQIVQDPALLNLQADKDKQKAEIDRTSDVTKRTAMLPVFKAEQRIKGELDPSSTKSTGLTAESVGVILKGKAIVDQAGDLANLIDKSGINYTKLRSAEMFSGMDDQQIGQEISNLADKVMRSRTGATAPPAEAANLKKIVAGDFSADPKMVAKLLRNFARSEASGLKSMINAGRALQEGTLEGELDQKISDLGGAATGAPQYEVRTTKTGQKIKVLLGQ